MKGYRYCPHCGAEYNPDIEKCVDCSIKLVSAEEVKEFKQATNERKAKRGRIFAVVSLSCMGFCLLLIIVGNILFRISHRFYAIDDLLAGLLATSLICSVILGFISLFTLRKSRLRLAVAVTIAPLILICMVVAIPNLIDNKTAPSRASVVVCLHQIYMAQRDHFAKHGRYVPLPELQEAGLLDESSASGKRSGYLWEIRSLGSETWSVVAWPENPEKYDFEWYSLYVDQTGILRWRKYPDKDAPLANKNSEAREDFSEQPDWWAK